MPMRPFSATTTIQQLLSFNSRRRVVNIFNNGTDFVVISQDQVGTLANGVPIPVGTSATLKRINGDEPELNLYVVANSGTQNLRVFEGFGDPDKPTGSEPASQLESGS